MKNMATHTRSSRFRHHNLKNKNAIFWNNNQKNYLKIDLKSSLTNKSEYLFKKNELHLDFLKNRLKKLISKLIHGSDGRKNIFFYILLNFIEIIKNVYKFKVYMRKIKIWMFFQNFIFFLQSLPCINFEINFLSLFFKKSKCNSFFLNRYSD